MKNLRISLQLIVLIGGTDMAAHTIDPAKAAAFLRGRLRDSFIADSIRPTLCSCAGW